MDSAKDVRDGTLDELGILDSVELRCEQLWLRAEPPESLSVNTLFDWV